MRIHSSYWRRIAMMLLSTLMLFSQTSIASAVGGLSDEQSRIGNGIFYYNPNDSACGQGSDSGNATAAVVTDNNDNLKTFLEFFTGKGLSLAAAAGMAGNIRQESNFNPAIVQNQGIASVNNGKISITDSDGKVINSDFNPVNDKYGFGIAQWTSEGRQQNLVNFAKSQNKPIIDLGVQLDFIWKEMGDATYKDMVKKLNDNKTDPVAAAAVFHGLTPDIEAEGAGMNPTFRAANAGFGYERSGDSSDTVIEVRGGAATSFNSQFTGQIQDGSGITDFDTSGSTSPTGETQAPTSCDSTTTTPTDLGVGAGDFTDNGEVAGWKTVLANSTAVDRLFGDRLEGDGWCASIVSRTWRGQDIGYGVNYAVTLWEINSSNGIGHADRSPKKGAILIYRSDNQAAGHVTIYLGNNKILNDGKIRDASYVEADGWGEHYLGWIDPNDLGWKTVPGTDNYFISTLSRYDE